MLIYVTYLYFLACEFLEDGFCMDIYNLPSLLESVEPRNAEGQLYHTILYKGLEHPRSLLSIVSPGTNPLQILRDSWTYISPTMHNTVCYIFFSFIMRFYWLFWGSVHRHFNLCTILNIHTKNLKNHVVVILFWSYSSDFPA